MSHFVNLLAINSHARVTIIDTPRWHEIANAPARYGGDGEFLEAIKFRWNVLLPTWGFKLPSISQTIYPRLLRKLQEITGVATYGGFHGTKIGFAPRKCIRCIAGPVDKGLFLITDLRVFPRSSSVFPSAKLFSARRYSRVPPSRESWESIEVRTTICWSPQSSVEDKTVRIGSRDKVENVSRD